jgi:8-oxo-dGTP pyrophosphatase MutT (NUDIX family)
VLRRPVFARHAASLLVVRHRAGGPEVLMGLRGAGHRFLPNRLVFPGGAVDPGDRAAAAAAEPSPPLLHALQQRAHPRLARAIAVAAARELAEETGLTLGFPPRLDRLGYLCRAITPPQMPIRFNARFLTVPDEATEGVPGNSRELEDVRFYPVAEALGLDLMDVTRWVLEQLLASLQAAPAEAGRPAYTIFRRGRAELDR